MLTVLEIGGGREDGIDDLFQGRDLAVGDVQGGRPGSVGFEKPPHLQYVEYFIPAHGAHGNVPVPVHRDEVKAFQPDDGFPDRRVADAELGGEPVDGEDAARNKFVVDDLLLEVEEDLV